MFTSFSERLKQAAQAGVESFDSAGQALQKSVTQAHLPTDGSAVLQKLPSITGLGILTDVAAGGSKLSGSPSKGSQMGSPSSGERRSFDSPRSSALANRLSSLVASGSPTAKSGPSRQLSRPSSPSVISDSSTGPKTNLAGPVDPINVPLPPSAPPSPVLSASAGKSDVLPIGLAPPSFLISDSTPASSVGTPMAEAVSSTPGASPFFQASRLGMKAVSAGGDLSSVIDDRGPQGDVPEPKVGVISEQSASVPSEVPSAPATETQGGASNATTDTPAVLPPVEAATESLPDIIPTDPSELTTEYTILAERVAKANAILAKASPMLTGGIDDTDALSGWLQMVNGKVEMGAAEMRRLAGRLDLQDSRMEEIRETHRMESASSTALVTQLRGQLAQQERNLSTQADQAIQIASLRSDLARTQTQAKEAEEKTSKAIALLKTVRSKLVKVEKERDEVEKAQAEDRNERSRMVDNLERLRGDREKEVVSLRQGFEKEVAGLREKYERDLAVKKGQWELDIITTKASHAKELAGKSSRITALSNTITALTSEKQAQFAMLQQRQEEVEAAKSAAEGHEARMKELEFQLREAVDRANSAEDTVVELRKENQFSARPSGLAATPITESTIPTQQAQDIPRLLAEASANAEAKLADSRAQLSRSERDRLEAEEEHARQLRDRTGELDRLKAVLAERDASLAEASARYASLSSRLDAVEAEKRALRGETDSLEVIIRDLKREQASRADVEAGIREEVEGVRDQLNAVQGELEEARNVAAQMRGNNRTLREEMRRIQSSAQLLERQRNPGVGYWSAGHQPATSNSGSGTHSPILDSPTIPVGGGRRSTDQASGPAGGGGLMSPTKGMNGASAGRTASPAPSEVGSKKDDEEEVNLEYLRNVILQFLEHKEMRANLVRVLAVILRFTPQELRRLNAKLTS